MSGKIYPTFVHTKKKGTCWPAYFVQKKCHKLAYQVYTPPKYIHVCNVFTMQNKISVMFET